MTESFFVWYRKELAKALDLPETTSWEDCLEAVRTLTGFNCDHEWSRFGYPGGDEWRQCFYCGKIEDL